ncbi:hypothetical protein L1049_016532 [Liquidambar formosana]|uniref:Uncharacterized protein n=1 Tax=Liquidambar formosana TaxID=63359 RepID=A0AAP0X7K9_LIQFO
MMVTYPGRLSKASGQYRLRVTEDRKRSGASDMKPSSLRLSVQLAGVSPELGREEEFSGGTV